jgi:hypothetical protein
MDAGCQVTQNIYARTAKVLREGLNDCCQRSSPLLRSANLGRVRQTLELTSSLLAKVSCEKAEKRMEGTLPTPITSRCSWSFFQSFAAAMVIGLGDLKPRNRRHRQRLTHASRRGLCLGLTSRPWQRSPRLLSKTTQKCYWCSSSQVSPKAEAGRGITHSR